MNQLELGHLHSYCIKHNLDTHLIDSSLTYNEALSELISFTQPPDEEMFNQSECEFVEENNDLLDDKELIAEVLSKPALKENTPFEDYLELCKECGYVEQKPEDYEPYIVEYMLKTMLIRIQIEDGSVLTRLRRKLKAVPIF